MDIILSERCVRLFTRVHYLTYDTFDSYDRTTPSTKTTIQIVDVYQIISHSFIRGSNYRHIFYHFLPVVLRSSCRRYFSFNIGTEYLA